MQPKLIYLTRRHPGLTRSGFTARWRQHGALGMSRPRWKNIARYVHCDVLDEGSDAYDGIGLIWHRSPQHRAAHLADTDSRLDMERDEQATFARPIVEDCLLAAETLVQRIAVAEDDARTLFAFFAVAPAAPTEARLAQLRGHGVAVLGCVRNDALPPERPAGWGLACARVEEFWVDGDAAALRAAAVLRASDATLTVITHPVPLYRSP
jgi:hypothetical protein